MPWHCSRRQRRTSCSRISSSSSHIISTSIIFNMSSSSRQYCVYIYTRVWCPFFSITTQSRRRHILSSSHQRCVHICTRAWLPFSLSPLPPNPDTTPQPAEPPATDSLDQGIANASPVVQLHSDPLDEGTAVTSEEPASTEVPPSEETPAAAESPMEEVNQTSGRGGGGAGG